jgi:hypothetical protein
MLVLIENELERVVTPRGVVAVNGWHSAAIFIKEVDYNNEMNRLFVFKRASAKEKRRAWNSSFFFGTA